jgi:hypothetical protein
LSSPWPAARRLATAPSCRSFAWHGIGVFAFASPLAANVDYIESRQYLCQTAITLAKSGRVVQWIALKQ